MACNNCFNGCAEIVSDKCVRYTGADIPTLGISKGDTLASVEAALATFIQNIITGNWNKRILEELEPKALKPLIFRLLGPEPYERYRNPIDLIGDIIKILEGLP